MGCFWVFGAACISGTILSFKDNLIMLSSLLKTCNFTSGGSFDGRGFIERKPKPLLESYNCQQYIHFRLFSDIFCTGNNTNMQLNVWNILN